MKANGVILVDSATGEKIDDVANYRTQAQQDSYNKYIKLKKYKLMGKRPFVCCFHNSIKDVSRYLTLTDCGAIMKLLLHVKLNNGGLLQKGGEPLKQKDFELILGKSKRQVANIVSSLEFTSMIIATKEGRSKLFYVNEEFHIMGKGVGKKYFTKLLTKKLKEIAGDLKLEELGLLYKVLPYFHYETCALAHNPNEQEEEKIKYMNRKELATAIDYTKDNVTILVKKLIKKGLVMSIHSSGTVLYYIHPDLMYRQTNDGNTEKFNALRALFEANERNASNRRKA